MSPGIVARCRDRLVEVARRREAITYGDLAAHLGIANQGPWYILDDIAAQEMAEGRPDVTLVVVYAATGLGRYNSQGEAPRSRKVDPANPDDVRAYNEALALVHGYWARQ